MLKRKVSLIVTMLSFCAFLLPCLAFGHSLWINVTEHAPAFFPKFGAQTKTYLGYGHRYPLDDFLPADNLSEYTLIGPDGTRKQIVPVSEKGFLESVLSLKDPGRYVIAVATKPGFYTMYVDEGKMHHKLGPKTGLKGVIMSLYYEQYAKSLVIAGNSDAGDYRKPIGHKLEVIPLQDPKRLRGGPGNHISVQVLFDGRPAKFCKVYATYAGFATNDDFAYATTTDQDGMARIRLSHWGAWLVKANLRLPAPDDMKGKCDELNYTATLTFLVP
jgi:uncharacterized GH25 family protein